MAIYSGFSHEKWWFSIVMSVYQRIFQPETMDFTTKYGGLLLNSSTLGVGSLHARRVTATPRTPSSPGLTPAPPCGAQEISSDGKCSPLCSPPYHIFLNRERERSHTHTLYMYIYILIKKYIYIVIFGNNEDIHCINNHIYMWYPNWLQKWLLETTSPWWTCKAAVLRQEFRLFIGPSLAPWWDLNNQSLKILSMDVMQICPQCSPGTTAMLFWPSKRVLC